MALFRGFGGEDLGNARRKGAPYASLGRAVSLGFLLRVRLLHFDVSAGRAAWPAFRSDSQNICKPARILSLSCANFVNSRNKQQLCGLLKKAAVSKMTVYECRKSAISAGCLCSGINRM
jgi:hypothetical protein